METILIDSIGWIGNVALALCGAPLAHESYKQGHSNGISRKFLWLWFCGDASVIVYVPARVGFNGPIIAQAIISLVFLAVVAKYSAFPRNMAEKNEQTGSISITFPEIHPKHVGESKMQAVLQDNKTKVYGPDGRRGMFVRRLARSGRGVEI
jgi:hypothetical protein